jgi:predicted Zn-dependent protease
MSCTAIYNPATQKKEYYFIDEEMEFMIGKNMAESVQKQNKLIKDKAIQERLNQIGQKIAFVSDRNQLKYTFYIVDSDEINAFALPAGYIFVNRGLIEKTSPDELAFVLGHEIGHVSARHSVKRLQSTLGINLLLSIALRNPNYADIQQAVSVVYEIVSLGYSRQDEYLADYLGVKYSSKAGYDPKAAFSLFEKMAKDKKENQRLVFLMSHPPLEKRIEKIKETLNKEKSQFNPS